MVKVEPFGVEQWMEQHEMDAKYNIAETCCSSISIDELKGICGDTTSAPIIDAKTRMTYGHIRGSPALRNNIAALYGTSEAPSPLKSENVLVTAGAIAANYLCFYTLVGPGDHVVCHYPTYQQLYSVPESVGADVSLWRSRPGKGWQPDVDELEASLRENTKLIVLNNPQNPTGAILSTDVLKRVIGLAQARGIMVLVDEVYRPIFHDSNVVVPSGLHLGYEKVIVTGSLSKAYALAGIRTGWVASLDFSIIEKLATARDYTTISVSQLDMQVAAYALAPENLAKLLKRNLALVRDNIDILTEFVNRHSDICEWIKPVAGTTAFIKFKREGKPVNADVFCKRLLEATSVMFLPGDVGFGMEFKGYTRIGYVCETEVLRDGLALLDQFLKQERFRELPLME